MAKVKGLIKILGTLDDLTFYKTQDGHLVKTKGGVSKARIATDPNFLRTRENNFEFGSAASAGKLLRSAVRSLMMVASDNRVTSRVTKLMTLIKEYDTTSARGARNVGVAISATAAKAEMIGFNFNIGAILSAILVKPYAVNTTTGVITIANLTPLNDIAYPAGATHATITGAWVRINFVANTTVIEFTNAVNLPLNTTASTVTLTPTAVPSGSTGTNIFLIAVEFFQLVNSVQYVLSNGSYNALGVIDVV